MSKWIKFVSFVLGLLAVFTLSQTVSAQIVQPRHTDPGWQAAYWNNTSLSGNPAVQRLDTQLDFRWGMGSPDPAVRVDQFSARWQRYIDVPPGMYRFRATSDDGMRVWVDDVLLIDQWYDHAVLTNTGDTYLGPGHHLVRVEFYENAGDATAQLSWAQSDGVISGWKGEYFNKKSLSGAPSLVRNDPEINFSWGTGSPAPGQVDADNFSVRWSRDLELPAGNYRFTMTVDDGARLFVNGHTLIDAWRDQAETPYSGDIYLPGGRTTVQMEYYENGGSAVARLRWDSGQQPPPPAQWSRYRSETYRLEFDYPASWRQEAGDPTRYGGQDGFFVVDAAGSSSLDALVQSEINHPLRPYGTYPSVENLTVDGQSARLIVPSADQPAEMRKQAALIVRYPQPVSINGASYNFFVLYASEPHIRRMASSLRFLTQAPPPVSDAVTVDDRDANFVRGGSPSSWRFEAEGHNSSLTWSRNNDRVRPNYNWARWYPNLRSGRYEVFVYIPYRYSTTAGARYWVSHAGGLTLRVIDQSAYRDEWVSLGTYTFRGDRNDYLSLADVTYEPYVSRLIAWDAARWESR